MVTPAVSLPAGSVVRLNPRVRRYDAGRTLLGGSPVRVLRLGAAARRMLVTADLTVQSGPVGALAEQLLDGGLVDPVLGSLPVVDLATTLTVVVPVRDDSARVRRLLVGLGAPADLAVVVVDDASADPEALVELCVEIGARLIRLPVNRGPAAARNRGLVEVQTPYVAFIDADVVADAGELARLLQHFADPLVALVAPRIRALSPEANWVTRYEDDFSSLDLGPHPGLVRPHSPIAWVPSACMLARTSILRGLPGPAFDEALRAGEDVDLGWRLAAAGWRIRYESDVVVRHEHRTTLRAWLSRKRVYGSSAADLAQRHSEAVAPAVLSGWTCLLVLGLLGQRRRGFALAGIGVALGAVRLHRQLGSGQTTLKIDLLGRGCGQAGLQAQSLLLRHWWPATAVAMLFSRRLRRAVLAATLVDLASSRRRSDQEPFPLLVARRLDDAAYGYGVWQGVWRRRSLSALLPVIRI